MQHAQRRRVQIIELAAASGPEKSQHGAQRKEQRYGYGDEQHTHLGPRNILRRYACDTTVSELSGMITAAQTGEMLPASVRLAAITL